MLARTLATDDKPVYIRPREDAASVNNPYDREWEAWKRKAVGAAARERNDPTGATLRAEI